MSRLYPIPYGAGVLLVPDYCAPQTRVARRPDREADPPRPGEAACLASPPSARA